MISIKVEDRMGAAEAVARLFTRTLTVPLVFFEAAWPDSQTRVDILAIDRAGSGDVHVVEVKLNAKEVTNSNARQLVRVPAHYRWIAVTAGPTGKGSNDTNDTLVTKLSAVGIGLISTVTMANGEPGANVVSRPVRAESFDRTKIGDFLKTEVPDIEFGEAPRPSKNNRTEPLTKTKIRRLLDEADALFGEGHKRAAYLLAWSAIEAAMKLLLGESASTPIPSPGVLVSAMREGHKLTASEIVSLSNALSIRNLLVHGFDDPSGVDAAYQAISAISRKLLRSLNRAA